jgi:hypothetical protein
VGDRISDIIKAHLKLAEQQLTMAEAGVIFSHKDGERTDFLAVSVEELRLRAEGLRAALFRHEDRSDATRT